MSIYFPQVVIPTPPPQVALDVTLAVQGGPPIDSLVALVDTSWNLQVVFAANSRIQKFPANTLQGDHFLTGWKYTEPKAASARLVTLTGEDQSFYIDIDEGQRPQGGNGLLSGSFPLSMITQGGNLPSQAVIRILYRPEQGTGGDGYLVATTACNADGTWQVAGLDESLKFDIVARIPGFNDVIISDVQPTGTPLTAHFAGIKEEYEYEEEVSIQVVALGGTPPYSYTVNTPPEGLTFDSGTGYITGSMPAGDLMISITVTDAMNGSVTVTWEGTVDISLPTTIGEEFGGGYYIGNIVIAEGGPDDGEYAIIMGGADSQPGTLTWKNPRSATSGTDSTTNGMANTLAMQANDPVIHYAGMYCLGYNGGGFDDWYMPAKDELDLAWVNRSQLAVLAMDAQQYWSSTQNSAISAWSQSFSSGTRTTLNNKNNALRVRPVRRLKI